MNHITTITTSGIVAAMLTMIVGTVGLGTKAAHASDADVPFGGSYSGHAVFTSDTTLSFDGIGIAERGDPPPVRGGTRGVCRGRC